MNAAAMIACAVEPGAVRETVVVGIDGAVVVRGRDEREVRCRVLECASGVRLRLAVGDAVLVWQADPEGTSGVVLGRLGAEAAGDEPPGEIVLEATEQLTLRVGDGSITLRADGRILIKGRDLVSSAQRLNRIKGGAVSIN
jgi:hypothetical protein